MRVPSKYLFYDGLPNAKDIDKIMANNGYQSPDIVQAVALPGLDTSQRQGPINAADSINTNNLNPAQMDWNYDNLYPKPRQHNPNHFGQYFNTALGIADSLIPGEKIHKNYVTQPLPVYNPYPSGTGSQAIMDNGGYISDSGADIYAKNGNWIKGAVNPAHKGYCTPMTKSTCTPKRKAFAMTMKKHHGFHDDGGEIYGSFTNLEDGGNLEGFVYGRSGGNEIMLEPYDKITAKSGIHIKPENRGKFTAYKKRTGKTTEEALHSSDPHVRQMANFARNAKKWHHGKKKAFDGIDLESYDKFNAFDGIDLESYDKFNAASGTSLSADKAKEMLRDGTANGKKLTGKQKRYFGFIAGGGKAQDGAFGDPEKPTGIMNVPGQRWNGASSIAHKAGLSDMISRSIVNTGDPAELRKAQGILYRNIQGTYGDAPSRKFLDEINIYNQRPEVKKYSPQQKLQSFYSMNSADPNVQAIKNQYKNFGYNPGVMYSNTPDVDNQQQQGVASLANGGYMNSGGFTEGSMHDLPEEHIAKLLKAGYKIEYL